MKQCKVIIKKIRKGLKKHICYFQNIKMKKLLKKVKKYLN